MPWESSLDFDAIAARQEEALPAALVAAMEEVRGTYILPETPIETGNLRGSGGVTLVDDHTAQILFPGPYARYQEYGVFYRHGRFGAPLTHRPPGRSRYLELGLAEGTEAAIRIIAKELGDAL